MLWKHTACERAGEVWQGARDWASRIWEEFYGRRYQGEACLTPRDERASSSSSAGWGELRSSRRDMGRMGCWWPGFWKYTRKPSFWPTLVLSKYLSRNFSVLLSYGFHRSHEATWCAVRLPCEEGAVQLSVPPNPALGNWQLQLGNYIDFCLKMDGGIFIDMGGSCFSLFLCGTLLEKYCFSPVYHPARKKILFFSQIHELGELFLSVSPLLFLQHKLF